MDFDDYYKTIYGRRWPLLREALLLPAKTVPYQEGLIVPYFLDRASILAALSLHLPFVHDKEYIPLILDACAAPGGKTLILASRMGKNTELLANEYSRERRRRLDMVLEKHLCPEIRSKLKVTGFNAAEAAGRQSERNRFTAIMLDVPCSSERHVIQNNEALEKWRPARPRFLANRQWALLSAAFLLLANGGSLVYATCSINPAENDQVAGHLLKKYNKPGAEQLCILDKPDFSSGEETEYGRIVLPDVSEGAGPLYVARFKKLNQLFQLKEK